MEKLDNLEYERKLEGKLVAGMDEAGRGPLAGPVFAAMVIMPLSEDQLIEGVTDSKKLTPKKRGMLAQKIKEKALYYSICSVDEKTIDEINILNADKLCMQQCLEKIAVKPDYCLVDYVPHLELNCEHQEIVKGDLKSYSIACASILAKTARDEYMEDLDKIYSEYQFNKHKGYGTKLHYEMIGKYGLCPAHRRSFVKKLLNSEVKLRRN